MTNFLRIRTVALSVALMLLVAGCSAEPDVAPTTASAAESNHAVDRSDPPDPPRIPDDFTWTGRYVVPDLDVEVPFSWHGNGGDFQMVAGGKQHPIHFTNLVHDGQLYTLTYKWPEIPRQPCSHVGAFSVDELNQGFAEASFVGRETLHGAEDRVVNHFRSVGVADLPPGLIPDMNDELPVRIPLMAADIYSDVDEPTEIRQLLHFGLQNLYDPNLDEWMIIDEFDDTPGKVSLPKECAAG